MNWKTNYLAVFGSAIFVLVGQSLHADTLAHWTFDESAGATTLVDSVNGFNGTAMSNTDQTT